MASDRAARRPGGSAPERWLVAAVLLFALQGVDAQKVKVEEEKEAYPTEAVDLRCQFVNGGSTTKLTQVSWIWEPVEGQRDNIAVFHPIYGQSFPNPSFQGRVSFLRGTLDNPSIRISDLRMADAGRYTCEYATYPSGNEQGTTTLVMLAKPRNSVQALTVQEGSAPVVVARCEAADGKPAASVQWLAGGLEGSRTNSTLPGADGTMTVVSEYRMVPTATDHGRQLSCMVVQRTQEQPWVVPVRLSVEYAPSVTIEGYDNWYIGQSNVVLNCLATGNPPPTIVTWRTTSGKMPDSAVLRGGQLTVRKVDDTANTTFICEARNKLGSSREQITPIVTEALVDPSSPGVVAGAVIGSLLALLLFVGLVVALLARNRRQHRRGYAGGSGDSVAMGSGNGGAHDGGGGYGNKARLLFGGGGSNGGGKKNGAGGSGGGHGPVYTYREGCDATGTLTETGNDYHHHHHHHHLHPLHHPGEPPTAHDILLSAEMDEVERRKFDLEDEEEDEEEEEEEERYARFGVLAGGGGGGGGGPGAAGPAYHARRCHGDAEEADSYLDDMESQRDGSVISRTAIYV